MATEGPARHDFRATIGEDWSRTITFTGYSLTGGTATMTVVDSSGTAVSWSVTATVASSTTITLAMIDTVTSTITAGRYSYGLGVTISGVTTPLLAGTLDVAKNWVAGPTSGTDSYTIDVNGSAVTVTVDLGIAATLAVGTVTTGAPGSDASVTISGTPPLQTIAFTIPRGNTGASNGTFTRYPFSNAAYTSVATGPGYIAQTGTLSASRQVTLPAANAVPAGTEIVVVDESGTVTTTNTITIAPAGSDTINGAATAFSIIQAYSGRRFISDGTSKWTSPRDWATHTGTGSNSIRLGSGANLASGTNSTAIGHIAQATATEAVAVGASGTVASATYTTAVGSIAVASASQATALGYTSDATGTGGAVAVGYNAQATGNQSVAVGGGAQSTATQTTTIGVSAATGSGQTGSTAIGYSASTGAASATAVGGTASAATQYSTAIGYAASSAGSAATAIGDAASAGGAQAIAIGYNADASGSGAICIGGSSASATGATTSVAIGAGAHADATGTVAIGGAASVIAGETGGTAIGVGSSCSGGGGGQNTAIGRLAAASAYRATAIGWTAVASAVSSTAVGRGTLAAGVHDVVVGRGAWSDPARGSAADGAIVIGSIGSKDIFFGSCHAHRWVDTDGATNTAVPSTTTITIHGPDAFDAIDGSATSVAGGTLILAAGRGTGTAVGGSVKLQVAPAGGVSNNTKNTLVTAIEATSGAALGKIGFYGATPVAQQTGVAVSAAGIHAALVSLGLITA